MSGTLPLEAEPMPARASRSMTMTPEQAIARAVAIAGSDHFGPDGWQEGLARSLDGFARMPLRPEVYDASVEKLVQDLAIRLRIEAWFKANPQVEGQAIEGPVFVVGLPRTGTTATVGMMALDERFRFMRLWEGAQPLPPPIAGEEDRDPRVIEARAAAAAYDKSHIHLFDADGPEEDLAVLAGFDMHSYHGAYPMPDDYVDWWLNARFDTFYAYHRRLLKLMQSRRPPHLWLLKSPAHLFRLTEIARAYPTAKFVMTHRDPVKIIASLASLHAMLYEERCLPGAIDPKTIGPRHLDLWAEGMRRGLAARAEIGEDRFVDVRNEDIVKHPIETLDRVYAHLGMPMTPAFLRKLEQYNSRNAPGAFGRHSYTAEQYGLSEDGIRAAFAGYIERFGL